MAIATQSRAEGARHGIEDFDMSTVSLGVRAYAQSSKAEKEERMGVGTFGWCLLRKHNNNSPHILLHFRLLHGSARAGQHRKCDDIKAREESGGGSRANMFLLPIPLFGLRVYFPRTWWVEVWTHREAGSIWTGLGAQAVIGNTVLLLLLFQF